MKKLQEVVPALVDDGLASFINAYTKLERETKKEEVTSERVIKIAFLTSFNARGFKETLVVKCAQLGIKCDTYVSEYNQYQQDIVDKNSELYRFSPDIVILFIDAKSILGELYFLPYKQTSEERKEWIINKTKELLALIGLFKSRSQASILLHNFEVPIYSPLGIQESKQTYGIIEAIEDLNSNLRKALVNDPQTYLFQYDAFCSKYGKKHLVDPKMYYLGDMRIQMQLIPALCDEYLPYIKARLYIFRKCLVLDLDETLWGGNIGEDGIEGIKLGPTQEGLPYWEFQQDILALYNRGIILAINSHNNLEDVLKVLREHPYMVLKEEHFACMQVNWNDKVSNMRAISEELNIGLDSLVFFDNDVVNREIVKKNLPEVLVASVPDDASLYVETLRNLNEFNTMQLTKEDLERGSQYSARRRVSQSPKSKPDIRKYLKDLEIKAIIEKATPFSIPRLAQLTQKTNQFNMTTRRYSQEEVSKLSSNDAYFVFSIATKDKTIDYGIVGVVIIEKKSNKWRIDNMLLSCRVIGHKIEDTILGFIIEQAVKANVSLLIGEFIPTKKNDPAKDFYKNHEFNLVETKGEMQIWEYNTQSDYKPPDYIEVIIK